MSVHPQNSLNDPNVVIVPPYEFTQISPVEEDKQKEDEEDEQKKTTKRRRTNAKAQSQESAEARKESHKLIEQKRRQKINEKINELRELLNYPDASQNKAIVLQAAVDSIKNLKLVCNKLLTHHRQLQEEYLTLLSDNERLRKMVNLPRPSPLAGLPSSSVPNNQSLLNSTDKAPQLNLHAPLSSMEKPPSPPPGGIKGPIHALELLRLPTLANPPSSTMVPEVPYLFPSMDDSQAAPALASLGLIGSPTGSNNPPNTGSLNPNMMMSPHGMGMGMGMQPYQSNGPSMYPRNFSPMMANPPSASTIGILAGMLSNNMNNNNHNGNGNGGNPPQMMMQPHLQSHLANFLPSMNTSNMNNMMNNGNMGNNPQFNLGTGSLQIVNPGDQNISNPNGDSRNE